MQNGITDIGTGASAVPMWLKLVYTAYMAVLIPVYWTSYGPGNFLYFCDVALILTLVGIWIGSPLLISMCAVGILAPQVLWVVDYALNLVGIPLTGMTDYMLDSTKSVFLRFLSLFHGWLPFLLVYLVGRMGYDRRALASWSALAVVLLAVCWVFLPPPSPSAAGTVANVNYVYGMSETAPQTWMHPLAWLACLMIGLPLLMFLPTHYALRWWQERTSMWGSQSHRDQARA
jgi:hypothetical protein